MAIDPSSSISYNDYYTNPKAWQPVNKTTSELIPTQGSDGQQSIEDATNMIYPDAPSQTS